MVAQCLLRMCICGLYKVAAAAAALAAYSKLGLPARGKQTTSGDGGDDPFLGRKLFARPPSGAAMRDKEPDSRHNREVAWCALLNTRFQFIRRRRR